MILAENLAIATRRRAAGYEGALREGVSVHKAMSERGSLGQLSVDFRSLRIDAVNPALCALSGFSTDELIGGDLSLIFPADQNPTTSIAEHLANGTTDGYSAEHLLQRRDGTTVSALSTVSVVRDSDDIPVQLLVLTQDLTQQRATERARERSRALLDAAIATLPVTFTTLDRDLRVTSITGSLERAGANGHDFVGKHFSEITDDPAVLASLQRVLAGSESTTRTLLNGETYLTSNAPLRDAQRAVVGVISVATKITAEVAAEAELQRAQERTLFVAQHDPLTGLPSRPALIEHFDKLGWSREGAGALLLLDLDEFSLINDSLGPAVGDAVLLEVASRVTNAFPGLMVARYGGDGFAVVAPLVVNRADAMEAAKRICAVLDADVEAAGHSLRITASVGLALEQTRGSPSTLIRNADSALSHAKRAGTGQYRLYDDEMRRQVQHRLGIQDGLRMALSSGQLRIAYQPIVGLSDRRIVGCEALTRWTHRDLGQVSPTTFIPIAEQSGLIVPLGQWVMNTACKDTAPLQRAHGMYISVNVSVRQLIGGSFAEWVEKVLAETGLPPDALTVEVTESALMDDVGSIRIAFDRLRSRGVKVSIDDFGTGYSSLARLQRLPVDVIKLDRAFVADVHVRSEARAMASAILHLSAAIGAAIVAEGIESEAEAATLLDLGYTVGQGYLFARPMPIEDLAARLCDNATGARAAPGIPRRVGGAHRSGGRLVSTRVPVSAS